MSNCNCTTGKIYTCCGLGSVDLFRIDLVDLEFMCQQSTGSLYLQILFNLCGHEWNEFELNDDLENCKEPFYCTVNPFTISQPGSVLFMVKIISIIDMFTTRNY